jgi:hypothetical protein
MIEPENEAGQAGTNGAHRAKSMIPQTFVEHLLFLR